jgi:hypothetical protein
LDLSGHCGFGVRRDRRHPIEKWAVGLLNRPRELRFNVRGLLVVPRSDLLTHRLKAFLLSGVRGGGGRRDALLRLVEYGVRLHVILRF